MEQLRKQAKDLLHQVRAGDPGALTRLRAAIPRLADAGAPDQPALSDAQLALAREYGFESWPKLVHHVETVNPAVRLEQFSRLAEDLLAAYRGDSEALQRISEFSGSSYSLEWLQNQVTERLAALPAPSLARVSLPRPMRSYWWPANSGLTPGQDWWRAYPAAA